MFVFIQNKVNLNSPNWKTLLNQTELNMKGGGRNVASLGALLISHRVLG